MYIDRSLYPEESPPESLDTLEARADYVARVCAAWDFGIVPEPETLSLLAEWRDVLDLYPLPSSVAYHTLRALYRWPPVPAGWIPPRQSAADPEDRIDPCADMV
jgi:hypothetical protein